MPATLPALLADGPVALDGGLATELEARGHDLGDALWSARLLRDAPGEIVEAHLAYLRAGARVIETASYQASVEGFRAAGLAEEDAEALLAASVRLAQEARDRFARERSDAPPAMVAASIGPYGAALAGGQEYTGDYGPAVGEDELAAFHRRRLRVLVAAAPDAIAAETLPRVDEARILARLLDELDAPPAWMSFAGRDGAMIASGEPIEAAVLAAASSRRVVAVGVNCTAPEHVASLLRRARRVSDLPLVAYPNSGRVWDGAARAWRSTGSDHLDPGLVASWTEAGARLVGGCCGIGPAAIAALSPLGPPGAR